MSDRSKIEELMQVYREGVAAGDPEKMRSVFHTDARMFGSSGGKRYDVPIADFISESDGHPADVEGSYKSNITSIEPVEDIASVTVEEDGYWGTVSFHDVFTLVRIDGDWKIATKAFAHTGGELPPE